MTATSVHSIPPRAPFLGQLLDAAHNPIANTGLWGLIFGNGGSGGNPNTLYIAAGIEDETQVCSPPLLRAGAGVVAAVSHVGALAMAATRRRGRRI
jgi:hypothetical protein